jgi:tRNA(Ile)-lysidine synthase
VDKYQQFSDNRKRLFIEYCISLFNPLNSFLLNYSIAAFDHFVGTANTGTFFYFSKDLLAVKNRNEVRLMMALEKEKVDIFVDVNSSIEVQNIIFEVKEVDADEVFLSADKSIEYICGDSLNFPLRLRNWNFGDTFLPLGMKGKQKLSNFFINRKVSIDRKKEILVLQNEEEIIWVVGMRLDNRYKLNDHCKRIIKVSQKESLNYDA